jgi:RNA polymerase sigma-70 factor (ECF subfamily)
MDEGATPGLVTLEALYDAYHRQALGLAYRLLNDVGDAEDVVQDVFLSAWRAANSYDAGKGSTRTWILAMVRNRAIDILRARRRRPVSVLEEQDDLPGDEDPAAMAMIRADGQVAYQALATLPEPQRQVVEMVYFQGLSHTEVADRLAIPVGTIKSRLRLAMDRLRGILVGPENSPSLSQ